MSDRSDSDVAPEPRALPGCCTAIEWSNEPCHRLDKSTCQVDESLSEQSRGRNDDELVQR